MTGDNLLVAAAAVAVGTVALAFVASAYWWIRLWTARTGRSVVRTDAGISSQPLTRVVLDLSDTDDVWAPDVSNPVIGEQFPELS